MKGWWGGEQGDLVVYDFIFKAIIYIYRYDKVYDITYYIFFIFYNIYIYTCYVIYAIYIYIFTMYFLHHVDLVIQKEHWNINIRFRNSSYRADFRKVFFFFTFWEGAPVRYSMFLQGLQDLM